MMKYPLDAPTYNQIEFDADVAAETAYARAEQRKPVYGPPCQSWGDNGRGKACH